MNDRHIVERILLPILMHTTVIQAVDAKKTPGEFQRIVGLLQTAIAEPLRLETPRSRDKLLARADRHRIEILSDTKTTDELGLLVYFLMKEISESVYAIGEGTPLFLAIEMFLAALEDFAEDEALMQRAEERGKVVLDRLRSQGLYRI